MAQARLLLMGILAILALFGQACTAELSPEQKEQVAHLKQDLERIHKDIERAKQDDAAYIGGLIKTLIAVRLEVLRTNEALVEQRIHTLEGRARSQLVVNVSQPDAAKTAELAKDIEAQKAKVAEARVEADRYSGGLIQAMAEASVATARNTLTMLEQQYFIARYGLAIPTLSTAGASGEGTTSVKQETTAKVPASAAPTPSAELKASTCLKIDTFDSSILSSNNVFTELAWKVDVSNSCAEPFGARVKFTIYDKDEFKLDSDDADIHVPAHGTGKARGKMLVSPPEKAHRMAKQGASISAW
jgi:hypothetical protein